MRNEVETRLWWFGLAFVVWLFEGWLAARLRAAEVFGVVWVVLQVARLPHVLRGRREDDAG